MRYRKFGNTKVKAPDGTVYDSKREYRRGQELQLLQKCGEISDLKMQVRIPLLPKQSGERAVDYIADYTYHQNGTLVVEDVKSKATKTAAYVLKRKMLLFFHGIHVKEVL